MKKRCTNSKFLGCASLANHKWQINERGYANVVPNEGQSVEGILYEIDAADELKLDVNEGIAKKAYTKQYMLVTLRLASSALYRRPVSWIVEKGGPDKVHRLQRRGGIDTVYCDARIVEYALVYVSSDFVDVGQPKPEYVNRINAGITDAIALGLDPNYVQESIRPFIPEIDGVDPESQD